MKDLKHLATDRTGRGVTDTSAGWVFACGFMWATCIWMFVDGVTK